MRQLYPTFPEAADETSQGPESLAHSIRVLRTVQSADPSPRRPLGLRAHDVIEPYHQWANNPMAW